MFINYVLLLIYLYIWLISAYHVLSTVLGKKKKTVYKIEGIPILLMELTSVRCRSGGHRQINRQL